MLRIFGLVNLSFFGLRLSEYSASWEAPFYSGKFGLGGRDVPIKKVTNILFFALFKNNSFLFQTYFKSCFI